MITFIPGQVYHRITDIHEKYNGQRQGGISTPSDYPVVFLFTGEQGTQYGYEDGFHDDGTFWYTGEGQVGDMEMIRGNLAIRDHQRNRKQLHLFQYVRKGEVQYIGPARYQGHRNEVGPDREKQPRKVIVFELALDAPIDGAADLTPVDADPDAMRLAKRPLDELRQAALLASKADAPPSARIAVAYSRSTVVKAYVLRRANGVCEGCRKAAPFETVKGAPYLEPHHIRRRADNGPDHPWWVIALCPNCHARVHHGVDGHEYNVALAQHVQALEQTS